MKIFPYSYQKSQSGIFKLNIPVWESYGLTKMTYSELEHSYLKSSIMCITAHSAGFCSPLVVSSDHLWRSWLSVLSLMQSGGNVCRVNTPSVPFKILLGVANPISQTGGPHRIWCVIPYFLYKCKGLTLSFAAGEFWSKALAINSSTYCILFLCNFCFYVFLLLVILSCFLSIGLLM